MVELKKPGTYNTVRVSRLSEIPKTTGHGQYHDMKLISFTKRYKKIILIFKNSWRYTKLLTPVLVCQNIRVTHLQEINFNCPNSCFTFPFPFPATFRIGITAYQLPLLCKTYVICTSYRSCLCVLSGKSCPL
jgi:hypothetical protein